MAERLDRYSGKLSAESIAAGMNAAAQNAQRLATDAQTLFELGRYPTSASLSILSIEESGKISVLRELALATTAEARKVGWRRFRSHTAKNVLWMFPTLVAVGAARLDDFKSLFNESAEHPLLLDQVKQISIYVDCYANGHWSEPNVVVDGQLAESVLAIAQLLQPKRSIPVREVELWIRHLGPEWGRPKERMEAALVDWYAAMQSEGLASDGPNKMSSFIWPGFSTASSPDGPTIPASP